MCSKAFFPKNWWLTGVWGGGVTHKNVFYSVPRVPFDIPWSCHNFVILSYYRYRAENETPSS